MRCFVAMDVPIPLHPRLAQLQRELEGLDTSLVPPTYFHFTLKFLGEVSKKQVPQIMQRLKTIKQEPCMVRMQGIGFFPSLSSAHVVWAGAESPAFEALHKKVHQVLADMFSPTLPIPHMTLARIKSLEYISELKAFKERHAAEEFGRFMASRISFKQTTKQRKQGQLMYEDLATFDLG